MFYHLLEKAQSPINGEITIYSVFGSARMTIGGLLQSGGIVADIWKKAANITQNQKLKAKSILILGLGCGTAAKIFSKKYPEAQITGVEIDPVVINLGKKYFGLGEIPNLKIVCQDAIKYTSEVAPDASRETPRRWKKFDLVIVDMYQGEKIPTKTESLSFLRSLSHLMKPNGFIVFNRIFWDEHKKEAEMFVKKVEKIFPKVELVRTVANLLVFCQKTR